MSEQGRQMKFAYVDPPYLGQCKLYKHNHNETGTRPFDGGCWDAAVTHEQLILWLYDEYPDGWVLSASSPSLPSIMSMVRPDSVRIGAWVKPFASFKPGINPGYCWEPVVFVGGRKRERTADTVRDYVTANIVLEKGTIGAKPAAFCDWVLDLMGYEPGDTFDDVFVGSGSFGRVRDQRSAQQSMPEPLAMTGAVK
jgi:hypothetical protein